MRPSACIGKMRYKLSSGMVRGLDACLSSDLGRIALTCQELLHNVEAILQAERQDTNRGADRVPTANPIPESKGIVGVNAKLRHKLQVGAHCHHVLGHRVGAKC